MVKASKVLDVRARTAILALVSSMKPMIDASEESFRIEMNCPSVGGIAMRIAWGTMTLNRACTYVIPME
jgi:hypothetical protein